MAERGESTAERLARLRAELDDAAPAARDKAPTPAKKPQRGSVVRGMVARLDAERDQRAARTPPPPLEADAFEAVFDSPEAAPQAAPKPAPRPAPPTRGEPDPPAGERTRPPRPAAPVLRGARPFAGYEWSIAGRYLRARRKEGFISVIAGFSLVGIALGVATLIIVMAVMTGFREELIGRILGVNAHVNVYAQGEPLTDYLDMASRLSAAPGVVRAAPTVEGQVMASSPRGNSGVIVRGVRRDDLFTLKAVAEPETSSGSLDEFGTREGVAIGSGLARKLGLGVNDVITLISPEGNLTPFGVQPRIKAYPILNIFTIGMSEYDSAFVYMPLEEAQLYFNKGETVDTIELMVADPNDIEQFDPAIRAAAGRPVALYDWRRVNSGFISALDVERKVMFIILTLIILVAAFNIISGLVMLVKDKARDIAIMRTMGVSRNAVLRIFFICGASIGVIGTAAGVALGLLIAYNIKPIQTFIEGLVGASLWDPTIRFLTEIPAKPQWGDTLTVIGIALGLSFLATLFPARRAAKLDPVEALRYE